LAGLKILKDNALSFAMFALFGLCLGGHSVTGWLHHNQEETSQGRPPIAYADYVRSGDFIVSVAENWESEFLQMAAFVALSAWLVQRGAAESKKPADEQQEDEHEEDPEATRTPNSPWPVRRGGLALSVYKRSLSLSLGLLFAASFFLHALGGTLGQNEDAAEKGQPAIHLWQYVASSKFWFESFQNWQSEFLSVGVLIILSIFLRQQGSPESKPVAAPHAQTGST
jgi:hypothetical protein